MSGDAGCDLFVGAPARVRVRGELLRATCVLRTRAGQVCGRTPLLRQASQTLIRRELQELNDTLASTSLAGHYSVGGGLLLGWAREGRVLDHDTHDVDFWVYAEDGDRVEAAAAALARVGFRPLWRYRNTAGVVTEYTFVRRGARFEFFLLFPAPSPGRRRYFLYDRDREIENEIADQPVEPFVFLDRDWLKPCGHEEHLRETYGRWEEPDPGFDSTRAPCVVTQRPRAAFASIWSGSAER